MILVGDLNLLQPANFSQLLPPYSPNNNSLSSSYFQPQQLDYNQNYLENYFQNTLVGDFSTANINNNKRHHQINQAQQQINQQHQNTIRNKPPTYSSAIAARRRAVESANGGAIVVDTTSLDVLSWAAARASSIMVESAGNSG